MFSTRAPLVAVAFLLLLSSISIVAQPGRLRGVAAEDCAALAANVTADTASYLYEKKAYRATLKEIKILDARLDEIRREQTRYFAESGRTNSALDKSLTSNTRLLAYYEEIKPEQFQRAVQAYRLLQKEEARLKTCQSRAVPTAAPAASPDPRWEGDYLGGTSSIHVMISGSTVRGNWSNSSGGGGSQKDEGDFVCPDVSGDEAHCTYTATYDDGDKTISGRKGRLTLGLHHDVIGMVMVEDSDSCAPKEPHKSCSEADLGYTPQIHPGAEFTGNWTRVQGA